MSNTNSIYVVAIILFIISLPIILVGGIVSVVQEVRRVREARIRGERLGYIQPKLLAGILVSLFALTISAAGAIYAGISYKQFSTSLYWIVITLVVLAAIFGFLYLLQVLDINDKERNRDRANTARQLEDGQQ